MPFCKTALSRFRWKWAGTFLCVLVAAYAFRLRWPWITRELWFDEIAVSRQILLSSDILSLRTQVAHHAQPLLDDLLRKFLYFPIFGYQEVGLRIPSLILSVVTVALATQMAFTHLSREPGIRILALLGAAFSGYWLAHHPMEIQYSVEARHYSMIALVSLAWTSTFVLRNSKPMDFRFGILSLIFLNTHYFSFPFVAFAYAFRSFRFSLREGFLFFGLLLVTVAINFKSLQKLVFSPLYSDGRLDFHKSVADGIGLWSDYVAYLDLPVHGVLVMVFVPIFYAFSRRSSADAKERVLKLVCLVFLVLPAFFVMMRLQSSRLFSTRYYIPFLGIGFVTILMAFESAGKWFQVRFRINDGFDRKWAPLPLMVVLVFLGSSIFSGWSELQWPLPNFSDKFRLFEEIKRSKQPTFIVSNPCWGNKIPEYYWLFLGNRIFEPNRLYSKPKIKITDTACREVDLRSDQVRGPLEQFLENTPNGQILFFQIHALCPQPKRSDYDRIFAGHPIQVSRTSFPDVGGGSCLWRISGVKKYDELESVARNEGFPIHLKYNFN